MQNHDTAPHTRVHPKTHEHTQLQNTRRSIFLQSLLLEMVYSLKCKFRPVPAVSFLYLYYLSKLFIHRPCCTALAMTAFADLTKCKFVSSLIYSFGEKLWRTSKRKKEHLGCYLLQSTKLGIFIEKVPRKHSCT